MWRGALAAITALLAGGSIEQERVYAGSNWYAVRTRACTNPARITLTSPTRRVVEFPAPADAEAFYAKSVGVWRGCAPGSYTYSPGAGERTKKGRH